MKDLGHTSLDVIKMDIEGAEYEVLDTIIEDKIDIGVLCVEFHHSRPFMKIIQSIRNLMASGYSLVSIDG